MPVNSFIAVMEDYIELVNNLGPHFGLLRYMINV